MYNELTVTRRTYMLAAGVLESHSQTRGLSHELVAGKTAKSRLTKTPLENANLPPLQPPPPPSKQAGFHEPLSLPPDIHQTQSWPREHKGCFSRRGAGTMNPFTLETGWSGREAARPHPALGAHQQSLHKGYWDDNAGVTRRPMSASSRSLVHS